MADPISGKASNEWKEADKSEARTIKCSEVVRGGEWRVDSSTAQRCEALNGVEPGQTGIVVKAAAAKPNESVCVRESRTYMKEQFRETKVHHMMTI